MCVSRGKRHSNYLISSTTGSDSENDEIEYLETKKVCRHCVMKSQYV